jgi:hypothetical protein
MTTAAQTGDPVLAAATATAEEDVDDVFVDEVDG